jgi:hypothetical protein
MARSNRLGAPRKDRTATSDRSAELDPELQLLHLIRVRGFLPCSEGHAAGVAHMVNRGMVVRSGRGVVLTIAGHERHAVLMGEHRERLSVSRLLGVYKAFSRVNARVEDACVTWQLSPRSNEGASVATRELTTCVDELRPALVEAGVLAPHLQRYLDRLQFALSRTMVDHRYLTSPHVDSFHGVWFELHEDLLATLGIERDDSGPGNPNQSVGA